MCGSHHSTYIHAVHLHTHSTLSDTITQIQSERQWGIYLFIFWLFSWTSPPQLKSQIPHTGRGHGWMVTDVKVVEIGENMEKDPIRIGTQKTSALVWGRREVPQSLSSPHWKTGSESDDWKGLALSGGKDIMCREDHQELGLIAPGITHLPLLKCTWSYLLASSQECQGPVLGTLPGDW